jgi:hypothetical protein
MLFKVWSSCGYFDEKRDCVLLDQYTRLTFKHHNISHMIIVKVGCSFNRNKATRAMHPNYIGNNLLLMLEPRVRKYEHLCDYQSCMKRYGSHKKY